MSTRPHPTPKPSVPVVAYVRVSQIREEMISPDIQLDSIRHWAAMRNRHIVAEIIDPNATGRNFDRKIQKAIEMVEEGVADEIVVYKFSRFGRTRRGWELNFGRLEDVGGDLVSSTEEVDASTATGKLTRGMLKEIAAFESDRFSDQWKDTAAYREQRGLPHTATPRFGYVHHKCTFQMMTKGGWRIIHAKDPICRTDGTCKEEYRQHPMTGPALKTMYKMYVSGSNLQTIANWCIRQALPTPDGGVWRSTGVSQILDSGFGAGLIQVGVHKTSSKKAKRNLRERDWLPGAHEGVIKKKVWNAYVARRVKARGPEGASPRSKWPLSGITRCGRCEGPMTCTTGRGGPGYIMRCVTNQDNKSCPGIWRITRDIEAAMFSALSESADQLESKARRYARSAREQKTDTSVVRKRLQAELKAVQTGRANLIDAVVSGALKGEEVAEKWAMLDAEEVRISASLALAAAPPQVWSPPQIRSLREDWPRLPLDVRREMVNLLIEKIVCLPDKTIRVTLSDALVPNMTAEATHACDALVNQSGATDAGDNTMGGQ